MRHEVIRSYVNGIRTSSGGTYTVAGNTITIQETGRTTSIPKDCKGPGVYKFSRPDANTLTFTLVSDACALRKKNVLLAQHRK